MSSKDSFYLQCPSNASMHLFPNNTLAHFTVHLPTSLELDDDYEVGLCELQLPQSWDNVRRGSNTFRIAYQYPGPKGREEFLDKEVPPGYYDSTEKLIAAIGKVYGATRRENAKLVGLTMDYNATTRRVSVGTADLKIQIRRANGRLYTPKAQEANVLLRDDIARLLGFRDGTVIKSGAEPTQSEFAATPSGGFHQMYVYTDIIHPQPHPDGPVSILRTIAVEGAPNREYLSKRFQKVYYVPLMKHTINTITFEIVDDTGKRVGFDYGKVLAVLHFRRRSSAS